MEPLVKMVLDDALAEAWSARPGSPVVPDDGSRRPLAAPAARRATAQALRRLADRLECGPRSRHAIT